MALQDKFYVNQAAFMVGQLANPLEAYCIEARVAAEELKPGWGVAFNSDGELEVPTDANDVEYIVTFDSVNSNYPLDPAAENQYDEVIYKEGDVVRALSTGVIALKIGGAVSVGDFLTFNSTDNDWEAYTGTDDVKAQLFALDSGVEGDTIRVRHYGLKYVQST